jgi:hypothetical protein
MSDLTWRLPEDLLVVVVQTIDCGLCISSFGPFDSFHEAGLWIINHCAEEHLNTSNFVPLLMKSPAPIPPLTGE